MSAYNRRFYVLLLLKYYIFKLKLMKKLKIDPITLSKLKDLFLIIILWIISARIVVMIFFLGSGKAFTDFATQPKALALLTRDLINVSLSGFIIGLITGLNELFVIPKKFKNKPVLYIFVAKTLVYLVSMTIASLVTIYIYECYYKNKSFLEYLFFIRRHFFSGTYLNIFSVGLLISIVVNLILFIRNKIGKGLLIPLLFGMYYNPRNEDRIFIFIDLKSSVEIAEKLEPKKYSKFLQDCFNDLEDIVIRHKGIIYQFVGDECVITWKIKKKTEFNNPIRLFFAFQKLLLSKKQYYNKNYGLIPAFKGAINSGIVSTAEVGGDLKSEIAFHGDVLNTTARIIELCKTYKEDLLVTSQFLNRNAQIDNNIDISLKSDTLLRGKNVKQRVYAIKKIEENI